VNGAPIQFFSNSRSLRAARVKSQPDLTQIFAAEAQLRTSCNRIAFGRSRYINRCCQGLQKELPLAGHQKAFSLAG
jgi:hypothetical protein